MKPYLTNLAGDDVTRLLRDLRDIGENFLMAGPVSRPGFASRSPTELYRDLVTLRGGVGGVCLVTPPPLANGFNSHQCFRKAAPAGCHCWHGRARVADILPMG